MWTVTSLLIFVLVISIHFAEGAPALSGSDEIGFVETLINQYDRLNRSVWLYPPKEDAKSKSKLYQDVNIQCRSDGNAVANSTVPPILNACGAMAEIVVKLWNITNAPKIIADGKIKVPQKPEDLSQDTELKDVNKFCTQFVHILNDKDVIEWKQLQEFIEKFVSSDTKNPQSCPSVCLNSEKEVNSVCIVWWKGTQLYRSLQQSAIEQPETNSKSPAKQKENTMENGGGEEKATSSKIASSDLSQFTSGTENLSSGNIAPAWYRPPSSGKTIQPPQANSSSANKVAAEHASKIPEQSPGVASKIPEPPLGVSSKIPELPPAVSSKIPESSKSPEQPLGVSSKIPEQPPGVSSKIPEQPLGVSPKIPEQPPGVSSKIPEQHPGVSSKIPEQPPGSVSKIPASSSTLNAKLPSVSSSLSPSSSTQASAVASVANADIPQPPMVDPIEKQPNSSPKGTDGGKVDTPPLPPNINKPSLPSTVKVEPNQNLIPIEAEEDRDYDDGGVPPPADDSDDDTNIEDPIKQKTSNDAPSIVVSKEKHPDDGFEVAKVSIDGDPTTVNVAFNEDPGMLNYFICFIGLLAIGYLLFHNKKRLIAYVVEGRRPQSGRRRSSSTSYRKLENNFD